MSGSVGVWYARTMADSTYPIPYRVEGAPPFEFVPNPSAPEGSCPEAYRSRIVIDTIHDGDQVPEGLLRSPRVQPLIKDGSFWSSYVRERDWGANVVAEHLARALGLSGYHRVTVARVVMDFNRFPGSSPPDADPVDRLAIVDPFARHLNHEEKRFILDRHYDAVSERMEAAIDGKLIKLSLHTYDEHNPSRTQRPEVSLITRSHSYQMRSRLPYGFFDPLFPDELVESCANTILRDRVALTLEKAGLRVEHNYPYCAPDGSLEVRSQPWFFFKVVKELFEDKHPEAKGDPAFDLVWGMLLNTNLRLGGAELLRGYLHRFRSAPPGMEDIFEHGRLAYESVARFVRATPRLVCDYKNCVDRPSTLAVEIRKDLVFRFNRGEPVEPRQECAKEIAGHLAKAITTYLREDHEAALAAQAARSQSSFPPVSSLS